MGNRYLDKENARVGAIRGWLNLSLLLHVLWVTLFGFVLLFGPFERIAPRPAWLPDCGFCKNSADAIATASELGRLDLVSIALTVLGVTLAFAALGSYGLIRGAAKDAAAEEAIEWLKKNSNDVLSPEIVKIMLRDNSLILTLANEVKNRISEEDEGIESEDAANIAASTREPDQ
jgi:hypothetical protein